jgi:hypothetical protein
MILKLCWRVRAWQACEMYMEWFQILIQVGLTKLFVL